MVDAPRSPIRLPHHRSRCLSLGAVAALLMMSALGACSDDGDAGSPTTSTGRSRTTSTTAESTPSTSQPPSTDLAAVEPFIAELLTRRDELATQIRGDPTLVEDEAAAPFADYGALFVPDSPQVDSFRTSMQQAADAGHAERAGPSRVLESTTLDTLLPAESPDVAFFQVCAFTDYESYDVTTGEVIAAAAVQVLSGGEARRVDGVWLLYDFLEPDPNMVTSHPSGTLNPCGLEESR